MKRIMRKFLSKIYRSAEFQIKYLVILCVRKFTYKSNSSISVTYDSGFAVDGTGAQLQRIISIFALANYFGFKYVNSEIKQVSIHALDPFQSEQQYHEYLVELNAFLKFANLNPSTENVFQFNKYDLKFWKFMFLLVRNRMRVKNHNLSLLEPYPVTEFNTQILEIARLQLSVSASDVPEISHPNIVIHYRQGVGGFVLYPGQNIARETPLAQFEKALLSIMKSAKPYSIRSLIILTDAPADVTFYRPPISQQKLWEGTPGYSEGVMTIQPIDFDKLSEVVDLPTKVIRGGNPLGAVYIMSQSDFLLMSKSSLSYLGGLLNKIGSVYYPKNFWHRPLAKWQVF